MESNREKLESKIYDYWHLSKTALCTDPDGSTRWRRLTWVKEQLLRHDIELVKHLPPKKLWMLISDTISPIR